MIYGEENYIHSLDTLSSSSESSCAGAIECGGTSFSVDCGPLPGFVGHYDCDICKCVSYSSSTASRPSSSSSYASSSSSKFTVSFEASGSIGLSFSISDYRVNCFYPKTFSWDIEGFVVKDLTSSWNTGAGDYYWYRIQGKCGKVTCDTHGVQTTDECKNMTFLTVVAARSLDEVCDILTNPTINPPANVRITSISKYSRPLEKSEKSDECNVLEDEGDFCQIPECLEYCIDENTTEKIKLSMVVYEAVYERRMNGGLFVTGNAESNRFKYYTPEFPLINITGSSGFFTKSNFDSECSVSLSGLAKIECNKRVFSSSGFVNLGGHPRIVSPVWSYSSLSSLYVSGSAKISRKQSFSGGFDISGACSYLLRPRISMQGGFELGGQIQDYRSPTYFYDCSGGLEVIGNAGLNFENIGLILFESNADMFASDISLDSEELRYSNTLTISQSTISPSCGCGPVGLSLSAGNNIQNSTLFADFLKSNSISYGNFKMNYKESEKGWKSAQNFYGKNGEEWRFFHSLSCQDEFWKFSFSVKRKRRDINELQTKFIIDIPASVICDDNNISTNISLDIKSGQFRVSSGKQILVVSPETARPTTPDFIRGVDVSIDGIMNDYRVYYDDIGLFGNSYWNSYPFEVQINPLVVSTMPSMELYRIFS